MNERLDDCLYPFGTVYFQILTLGGIVRWPYSRHNVIHDLPSGPLVADLPEVALNLV